MWCSLIGVLGCLNCWLQRIQPNAGARGINQMLFLVQLHGSLKEIIWKLQYKMMIWWRHSREVSRSLSEISSRVTTGTDTGNTLHRAQRVTVKVKKSLRWTCYELVSLLLGSLHCLYKILFFFFFPKRAVLTTGKSEVSGAPCGWGLRGRV